MLGVHGAVVVADGVVGEDEPAAGEEEAAGVEEAALDVVDERAGGGVDAAHHMVCLVVSRHVSHFLC